MFIRCSGYNLYGLCILNRSSIHWLAVHQMYPTNQASVKISTSFKVTSKTEMIIFLFCFNQKTPFVLRKYKQKQQLKQKKHNLFKKYNLMLPFISNAT